MRKSASLLLILLLVLTAAGCNEDPSENQNTEPKEEVVYDDYGGEEFIILQHQPVENPFGYKQDTLLADESLRRLNTVGERHNCKFKIESLAYGDAFTAELVKNISVMDNYCDIIFSHNCSKLRGVGNAGGLVAIDEVADIIDYKNHDKWGDVEALEAMMCKGVLYGVAPSLWLNYTPIPFYTLVFNNKLIKNFGVPNPHELYENRTWTRESLVDYIKTCTDLNATTPIYGMGALITHMVRQSILSNGCKMLEIGEDGAIKCGWDTEEAVEALTWIQKTINENIECFYNKTQTLDGDAWNYKNPFMNGETTFVLTRPEFIFDEIAYEVEDFGLMPWPAGPNVEYGTWPGYYENIPAVSIPIFTKDPVYAATLIDEIFEPLESYPDREAIQNYYVNQVFGNRLDVEILFSIGKGNSQYCYWPDGGDALINAIGSAALTKAPSENIKNNINLISQVIEEQIYPNYLAMDKYR